ncbi:calcium-activated chloride channel regulator 1-like [Podarcis raffonei]|uniref:calcium-activated chloride channel regulator 1-like n=1 Tax=Podarcis raffonei TaxID=65483 RepID=UPI0023291340|nr:calcium-activated chloride channel regulator 1-like [Podarcis raffonei]
MVFSRWLLLLVLQFLRGATGTMVKLNNGGFEDIVIAINPAVAEDNKIVDNIKDMIKEASAYLFSATEQRFYFKSVKVIIPLTWAPKPEYERVTIESYDKADVIVAEPYLKYGDDPYTLQYGGCGEQGRYIHFTPNFLTNDSLHAVYGSRGRVFVHEWAHLRWGVFDEYNNDAPFYTTGIKQAEATRCSAGVTGQYIFPISPGKTRKCKVESRTQLYEAGCQFIPDKTQTAQASIMYMQSLSSVTQFCNNSNHNMKATNMQNKLCNYRSTWEVIMNSTDFANSTPITVPPPDPTISFLQTQDRVLCLVFDVSGSMAWYNRINRLKQAAEIFLLQIIEAGSWVGIVTFNSIAQIKSDLQLISNDSVRQNLTTLLPTSAGGGTIICGGVRTAVQVFLKKYPNAKGCEIVLLTDGEDSTVSSCFTEVRNNGSIIHTIALGPKAAKELEMLADMTGGLKFAATDSLDSNGLIDAFTGISSGSGTISQQSIQLESKSHSVGSGRWFDGIVTIDKTVGNDTFFIVTWDTSIYPPGIFLIDPKGKKYSHNNFVIDNTNVRTARLSISGTAEVGDWEYSFMNTHQTEQIISITVTSRPASVSVPPVLVKPYMNQDTNKYPIPMVVYAEISQGFLPVIGANVTAIVEDESGKTEELELYDSGSGADILKYDGIYSRYFTSFTQNGRYNLKVRVQGKDKTVRLVRRQSQALYIPGFVENGEIKMNSPRPEATEDEIQANLGSFSRVASGGSFVVSEVPNNPNAIDVFPPCQITDLEVELAADDDEFLLSWTAPGNDYDVGQAERYEIKMSENPLELRDASFDSATSVNTTGLTVEVAGVKQSFQYKSENLTKENGSSIYFAIRAIDGSNNTGKASNAARAVVVFSTLPATPTSSTGTSTLLSTAISPNNTTTAHTTSSNVKPTGANDPEISVINDTTKIVIIVCASVIIICVIVSITICIVHKRRNRSPQTGM